MNVNPLDQERQHRQHLDFGVAVLHLPEQLTEQAEVKAQVGQIGFLVEVDVIEHRLECERGLEPRDQVLTGRQAAAEKLVAEDAVLAR